MRNPTVESLWMLFATGLFASCNGVIKYASQQGFNFWEIVLWRALFGCILIYAVLRLKGISIKTSLPGLYALRTLTGAAGTVCSVASVSMIPLGTANTLCNTVPIFMGLSFATVAFVQRKPQDWVVLANIALGFAGILMILQPTASDGMGLGAVYALGAAVLDACAYWAINRIGQHDEPILRIVFWFFAMCFAMGLAGCLFVSGFSRPTLSFVGLMAGIGLLQVVAMNAMTRAWAYGYIPLTSTLQFTTVVFCVLIGALVFGDRLSALTLCGIGLVVAAGIVSTLARLRKTRKAQ